MDRKTELELIEKYISEHGVTRWTFRQPGDPTGNWRDRKHFRFKSAGAKGGRNRHPPKDIRGSIKREFEERPEPTRDPKRRRSKLTQYR